MSQTNDPAAKDGAAMMRDLRIKVLTTPPSAFGIKPNPEFPRVCSIVMDWPLGTNTITVFSSCTGDASIYSTSTFGVIGGIGHETVRTAAKKFVSVSELHYDEAVPTKDYPYPKPGRVFFYLVCFDGVRKIDVDEQSLRGEKDKLSELYSAGQRVMTELRRVTQEK
jgi:hypothetical protein